MTWPFALNPQLIYLENSITSLLVIYQQRRDEGSGFKDTETETDRKREAAVRDSTLGGTGR